MDESKVRVASRDLLLAATRRAKRLHYNRQLHHDAIQELDPDGYNLLWVQMIHEHAEGGPVEPHYRCWALLKFKDTMEPQRTMLDIPMGHFNTWPRLTDVKEAQNQ